jgi:hypothetical protein
VIVQTLKSVVQKIKHIESDKLAFQKNLEGIATKVTEMTCSLPVFLFNEGIEEICNQLV